jgi:type VI protein secretion system component VasF
MKALFYIREFIGDIFVKSTYSIKERWEMQRSWEDTAWKMLAMWPLYVGLLLLLVVTVIGLIKSIWVK